MAGIAAIFFGRNFRKIARFRAGHIGINEQNPVTSSQVGDVLNLQLHVVLTLDTGEMQLRNASDQLRAKSIVSAPGITVSEQQQLYHDA